MLKAAKAKIINIVFSISSFCFQILLQAKQQFNEIWYFSFAGNDTTFIQLLITCELGIFQNSEAQYENIDCSIDVNFFYLMVTGSSKRMVFLSRWGCNHFRTEDGLTSTNHGIHAGLLGATQPVGTLWPLHPFGWHFLQPNISQPKWTGTSGKGKHALKVYEQTTSDLYLEIYYEGVKGHQETDAIGC